MAEKFFNAMLSRKFVNVQRLIWINRSVSKLERSLAGLMDLLDVDIEVVNLQEGARALADVDAVFCALSMSPDYYVGALCRNGCYIIDVSYPPVFREVSGAKLINIANTYFDHLVRKPVPKINVARAESDIDAMINFLEHA